MLVAQGVVRAGDWPGLATGTVSLGYDERFLRRRRLLTTGGEPVLVDLAETTDLRAGDALVCDGGRLIAVAAAEEEVLVIRGASLARLAWHIGNRHTPCEVRTDALVIRADHVLEAMLRGLGAEVVAARQPFAPEGGAYGMGRTMGHAH